MVAISCYIYIISISRTSELMFTGGPTFYTQSGDLLIVTTLQPCHGYRVVGPECLALGKFWFQAHTETMVRIYGNII